MPTTPLLNTDAATLRDGSRVVIRPLGADDRLALGVAFERMGEESRYRRFLGAMPRLSESQLRHLTDVDQHDHVALAAIDATAGSGIVGVARSVRLEGSDAEPALVVVDDWQGRGLGAVLLAALVDRSRTQGVRRYQAHVLAENIAILRLLGGLGELETSRVGPALQVTVDLPVRGAPRRT